MRRSLTVLAAAAMGLSLSLPAGAAFTTRPGTPERYNLADLRLPAGGTAGGQGTHRLVVANGDFGPVRAIATGKPLIARELTRWPKDGLGIASSIVGIGVGNGDEIDARPKEKLVLRFAPLTRDTLLVGLTDLYKPDTDVFGERGLVTVFDTSRPKGSRRLARETFTGVQPVGASNGLLTLVLSGMTGADKVVLTAIGGKGNDFSVQGVSQVPLPAAGVVFLTGLAGIGALVRRRRRGHGASA